ncbi:MAG: glycosyltransferase family 4 protein [Bacteroidales bacterium]
MKPELIYITSSRSSFVEVDLAILSKHYNLTVSIYPWKKKWLLPFLMFRQVGFLLLRSFSVRLIMISSAGYWSLVPVLFGKLRSIPVCIILNGSDCASLPRINYGNLRKPLLKNVCRKSLELADFLLPVSESLVTTENTYDSRKIIDKQGYQHFFPEIKTGYQVIFNGLDSRYWKSENPANKEKNSFISVFSASQYILKGGDLIVEIAGRFPECTFYMAGIKQPPDGTEVSSNIRFLGRLTPSELLEYYRRCQFHFQLSIFEGFGCTLCEAMLCECIPLGSAVNIIPMIIGDTGLILEHRDADLLEALINRALAMQNKQESGLNARRRIIGNFSLENRERQLTSVVESRINPALPVSSNS